MNWLIHTHLGARIRRCNSGSMFDQIITATSGPISEIDSSSWTLQDLRQWSDKSVVAGTGFPCGMFRKKRLYGNWQAMQKVL